MEKLYCPFLELIFCLYYYFFEISACLIFCVFEDFSVHQVLLFGKHIEVMFFIVLSLQATFCCICKLVRTVFSEFVSELKSLGVDNVSLILWLEDWSEEYYSTCGWCILHQISTSS